MHSKHCLLEEEEKAVHAFKDSNNRAGQLGVADAGARLQKGGYHCWYRIGGIWRYWAVLGGIGRYMRYQQ